jgi:hypothetical protein
MKGALFKVVVIVLDGRFNTSNTARPLTSEGISARQDIVAEKRATGINSVETENLKQ